MRQASFFNESENFSIVKHNTAQCRNVHSDFDSIENPNNVCKQREKDSEKCCWFNIRYFNDNNKSKIQTKNAKVSNGTLLKFKRNSKNRPIKFSSVKNKFDMILAILGALIFFFGVTADSHKNLSSWTLLYLRLTVLRSFFQSVEQEKMIKKRVKQSLEIDIPNIFLNIIIMFLAIRSNLRLRYKYGQADRTFVYVLFVHNTILLSLKFNKCQIYKLAILQAFNGNSGNESSVGDQKDICSKDSSDGCPHTACKDWSEVKTLMKNFEEMKERMKYLENKNSMMTDQLKNFEIEKGSRKQEVSKYALDAMREKSHREMIEKDLNKPLNSQKKKIDRQMQPVVGKKKVKSTLTATTGESQNEEMLKHDFLEELEKKSKYNFEQLGHKIESIEKSTQMKMNQMKSLLDEKLSEIHSKIKNNSDLTLKLENLSEMMMKICDNIMEVNNQQGKKQEIATAKEPGYEKVLKSPSSQAKTDQLGYRYQIKDKNEPKTSNELQISNRVKIVQNKEQQSEMFEEVSSILQLNQTDEISKMYEDDDKNLYYNFSEWICKIPENI
ncbi:MAG: hypothetical protein MHPSP_000662 [Paramarteilia canceri]